MSAAAHTLVALLALGAGACHEARATADAAPATASRPARPAGCREVAPGGAVQAALDDPTVSAVCLGAGEYVGRLRLARAVTLWGPAEAIILTRGPGTQIEVVGAHATVLGLTIDGTGGSFDAVDSAIKVTADDARVEGITIVHAVFGILVEQSHRARIIGNHVEGSLDDEGGLRGDTIRLWETRDSVIEDNFAEDGRDVVVWYSRGNRIAHNRIVRGRYGLHFMYSHDNEVVGNQLLHGVVGIFVMYSRNLHITDNLIADAAGAAGMAIGIKDSGNIYVAGNRLIHDQIGLYLDSSPMQLGDEVIAERNVLRLNDAAIVFHASGHHLQVRDNDLVDNEAQVRVDGGGDALDVAWRGNYFDDYAGYDLDGDGTGDVAFELRSLSNQLTSSNPGLAFFRGTPALALVDAAGHLDPMYQPRSLLTDPAPRMSPRWSVEDFAGQVAGQGRTP
jgi:nitrous oxidase accessory protein